MRTAIIIAIGFVLLAAFAVAGFYTGGAPRLKTAALLFMGVWFVAAAANLAVGVLKAGYSFTEELPIFLLIFALPAAVAYWMRRGSH
ncbi:MAG TPA: hypothetical protein VMF52_10155 [Steroidobacteraceae bacterium]|nr:hypothetical protein [Steroidobacteraceae bacterium]